jgi:CHAT domain-containing protein
VLSRWVLARTIPTMHPFAHPPQGAAALRKAMLAYMNDRSNPLNAHPAFWGPFSIIGEAAAR